jgi:hypothetical protein
MNEIIIKENKKKVIWLIIVAIIMLLACIFNLVIGIIEIKLVYIIRNNLFFFDQSISGKLPIFALLFS